MPVSPPVTDNVENTCRRDWIDLCVRLLRERRSQTGRDNDETAHKQEHAM